MATNVEWGKLPHVILPRSIRTKIATWTALAPEEISGLGEIEEIYRDDGTLYAVKVKSLYLLEQDCTGVETAIRAMDMVRFMHMMGDKIDDAATRVWWHSHVEMPANYSGGDNRTFQQLLEGGNVLGLLSNKHGDLNARYIIAKPIRLDLGRMKIVEQEMDAGPAKEAFEEFKGKIRNLPEGYGASLRPDGSVVTNGVEDGAPADGEGW